jgi:L-seryl-tRNA(Ser) seleniumtransferase
MPSIDVILKTKTARELESKLGRDQALALVRSVTEKVRSELVDHPENGSRDSIISDIDDRLRDEIAIRWRSRQQRVINATGVIVHTNLGRSRLSPEAVDAIVASAGYCNLEYDLTTGERGRRGESAEKLLADLVGAEDAVIVNNCAAAAFLVLSTFAKGGEVIVSRGELVEIGGDFRIPDVLEQSGAILREVGTTNRTKLVDYDRAICDDTRLILRVHPSNFRITGFTSTPALSELSELAGKRGLLLFEDAGSGALVELSRIGLDEPVISGSIKAGADLVSFSGDKLMGGTQAGMIVGRRHLIERLRRNPLYRALRPDKLSYAAIEATMKAFAKGTAWESLPVLQMLGMTADEIGSRARNVVDRVVLQTGSVSQFEVVSGHSAVGGGAAPDVELPTFLIAITADAPAEVFAERLRKANPPVIARIADERVLIDLRTVSPDEEPELIEALSSLAN